MQLVRTSFITMFRRAAGTLYQKRRLFYLCAGILLVILGSNALYRSAVSDPPRTDLPVFLRAAQAVEQNENIYDVKTIRQWNYVYPPLLAVVLTPFLGLPLPVNAVLWYALSAFSLWAGFVICVRLGRDPEEGFTAALIAFVLCLPSFLNTLVRGQLGVLSLFLALWIFRLHEKRNDVLCGLILALAVVLKPTPLAPVLFYFAAVKKWKTCCAFAAGVFLFALVIPSAGLGIERNIQSLGNYVTLVTHAVSRDGHLGILWQQLVTPFASDNQSVYAALTRIVWPSEQAMVENSNDIIRWSSRLAGLGSLAFLFLISLRGNSASGPVELVRYSLFCTVMLFFSPVTEHHHYTMMAIPYYAALRLAVTLESSRRRLLEAGLALAAFSYLFGLIFDRLSFWGVPVWGNLFFCGLLAVIAARPAPVPYRAASSR